MLKPPVKSDDNSGTCMAGSHWLIPSRHTMVDGVMWRSRTSSKFNGPIWESLTNTYQYGCIAIIILGLVERKE